MDDEGPWITPVPIPQATRSPPRQQQLRPRTMTTAEIWDTGRRSNWFSVVDDRRLHIKNKVYVLNKDPLIEKTVLVSVNRGWYRPLRGNIVDMEHAVIKEEEQEDYFTDPDRSYSHSCQLTLWEPETDPCSISQIVASMAEGESCMIRKTVKAAEAETPPVYQFEVFRCLRIWRRQILSEIPPLIIDIASNALPTLDFRDYEVTLHFKLYKRPTGEMPDLDPSKPSWTLVRDTRTDNLPFEFVLGQGRNLPCLELMMACISPGACKVRLMSSCEFVLGPFPDELMTRPVFEGLDLDPRYSSELQLEPSFDIFLDDIEVINISPPSYESADDRFEEIRKLGNELFKKEMYNRALLRYADCLNAMGVQHLGPGISEEIRPIAISAVLNSAFCYMKLLQWDTGLDLISQVLKIDPENVKGLFRKAICLRHRNQDNDLEDALECITLASMKEPNDSMIRQEKRLIKDMVTSRIRFVDGLKKKRENGWWSGQEESQQQELCDDGTKNEMAFEMFRELMKQPPSNF